MEKYANVFTYNRRTPRSIEHFEHVSNCFWLRVETKKEQPTHAANKHRMFEERILNRHRESQKVSFALYPARVCGGEILVRSSHAKG